MVACLLLGTMSVTTAAVYYGNAYDPESPGSGGTVAGGTLSFTDNGTTISGTFHRGNGSFQDNIVIFIDSRSGGFGNTTSFTDSTFGFPSSISGFNGTSRSTGIFASGFGADYAIALGVNNPTGGELFELAANGSLIDLGSVNLSPNNQLNEPDYTFRFRWSDIGLTGGSGFTYDFGLAGSSEAKFFDECIFAFHCAVEGNPAQPLSAENRVVVPAANLSSHLYASAGCAGGPCGAPPPTRGAGRSSRGAGADPSRWRSSPWPAGRTPR